MNTDALVGSGLLPDFVTRFGVRRLLNQRKRSLYAGSGERRQAREREFMETLHSSPIAIHQDMANTQHYEVPPRFFELVLGKRLKYSSGFWGDGVITLDEAEERMLALTCDRAQFGPGQDILELGCGWGSLALYLAQRFPTCRLFAVSNSRPQREFTMKRARILKIRNIEIETADVSHWNPSRTFDRIVSVEMFEHLRNWPEMFRRVASWLKPDGRFFMHVFTHREYSYPFENTGDSDFMARHFFTGGMMPSDGLALAFDSDLQVEEHWRMDGSHYARTSAAWLANMDANRSEIQGLFVVAYGAQAKNFWNYWRAFFMACEELWAFDSGREWIVSHYRFKRAP